MPKKKLSAKKRLFISIGVILFLFMLLTGGFGYYLGLGKIRYYIHKIEYRFYPEKFPNKSRNTNFEIYGIDVSHHNGRIDWAMVREKGRINKNPITFAFIKATEGKTLKDKNYKANFRGAKKANIICGAYHFYRPHLSSIDQFNNFKSVVNLSKGDLPPVLDVEIRGSLSLSQYTKGIINLLTLMENHYGVKPILYTNPTLYMALSRNEKINEYPLWLAAYTKSSASRHSDRYLILQYTEDGKVSGIKSTVDLNGFQGDFKKFQTYIIK
jgi:lysozyme